MIDKLYICNTNFKRDKINMRGSSLEKVQKLLVENNQTTIRFFFFFCTVIKTFFFNTFRNILMANIQSKLTKMPARKTDISNEFRIDNVWI